MAEVHVRPQLSDWFFAETLNAVFLHGSPLTLRSLTTSSLQFMISNFVHETFVKYQHHLFYENTSQLPIIMVHYQWRELKRPFHYVKVKREETETTTTTTSCLPTFFLLLCNISHWKWNWMSLLSILWFDSTLVHSFSSLHLKHKPSRRHMRERKKFKVPHWVVNDASVIKTK